MWAIIKDNKVVEVIDSPKPVVIDEIQHPKEIFTLWTDEDRLAVGVVPYVCEGDSADDMFHTSSRSAAVASSTKVVVTMTKTAKDIDTIKSAMKEIVSSSLVSYLSETDWIIVREQDNGTARPSDLQDWRVDLRSRAADLKTAIDSETDVASLEAIKIYDWPKNPRLVGE